MSSTTDTSPLRHRILVALSVALCALACAVAIPQAASAAYSLETFTGENVDTEGHPVTQAGTHPDVVTEFQFSGLFKQEASPKDATVAFPPGLIMNPAATPKCSQADLAGTSEGRDGNVAQCPPASQVGTLWIYEFWPGLVGGLPIGPLPIYNLEPPAGVPGQFGANFITVPIYFNAQVRPGDHYAISAGAVGTSQTLALKGAKVTIWGVPNSPVHDAERPCRGQEYGPCESQVNPQPLVTAPSNCSAGLLTTGLTADSWQEPELFKTASFDHDRNGNPMVATGCENMSFSPKLTLRPQSRQAASPTGVDVNLEIPQSTDPGGLSAALLDNATVTLPQGMAVNPSSVEGLSACSAAQIGLGNNEKPSCPDGSKIGSLEIKTPLLEDPMQGSVYLAEQGNNPFGSLLALYLVAEGPGVVVKIPGKIEADPQTGQLTTRFTEAPELPFETMALHLKGGSRAPLLNPSACGTYTTRASFSSWSAANPQSPTAAETVTSVDPFQITSGPNGGPCPTAAFGPKLQAGTASAIAGAYSPFSLRVSREDGEAPLGSISATLPKGLLAKLAGVPYCPDATLAAISQNEGTAAAQIAAPSCPAASQVGSVTVGAGAGPNPYRLETAKAYLAGPYKGAPLSLAVVAPVKAGPFDLGTEVVRNALAVDPETAQVTAKSDPLPQILHGIPLDIRDVLVNLDRSGFTLNPTSCDPTSLGATIGSALGGSATLSQRFQVGACNALGFTPGLKIQLKGSTKRVGHPALKAVLTAKPGEANIGRAQVNLPHGEFLDQGNLNKTCTKPVLLAGNCPKTSVYGKARAWTPLLEKPLEGPVYLVGGYGYKLPALVAELNGQIRVLLVGKIDTGKNKGIRSTFETVPDAPVEKFVLEMKGGKKYGLLENSENLCAKSQVAIARLTGQNGKVESSEPQVTNGCGKGGSGGKKKKAK